MELHQLAGGLRRMRTFVVLCALLGMALAAVAVQLIGPGDFRATATLLLDPNAVTTPQQKQFIGDPERYVDGQLRVIESKAIADQAAEKIAGETGDSLAQAITFQQVTGSDLVDVTATADNAALARDRANALVTTYVEQRRAATKAAVDDQLEAVRQQIADLEARLARTTDASQAQERGLLLNQYQTLITTESTLAAPGVTQDLTAVVDPAVLPRSAQRLPLAQVLGMGLALGAGVGAATAVSMEARNPHVGTPGQVERTVGAPTLARFSHRGPVRRRSRGLPPPGARAEARIVASVLVARPPEGKPRLVAVTTVGMQAPPAELFTSLEMAFREQGLDTVTLDFTDDRMLPAGALDDGHGPATEEVGRRPRPSRPLAGPSTTTPLPLRDEHLRALVEDLPRQHELVLLKLPPVLSTPLAASAGRWVDDILLVVDVRRTTQHELDVAWPMFDAARERCHVITYH